MTSASKLSHRETEVFECLSLCTRAWRCARRLPTRAWRGARRLPTRAWRGARRLPAGHLARLWCKVPPRGSSRHGTATPSRHHGDRISPVRGWGLGPPQQAAEVLFRAAVFFNQWQPRFTAQRGADCLLERRPRVQTREAARPPSPGTVSVRGRACVQAPYFQAMPWTHALRSISLQLPPAGGKGAAAGRIHAPRPTSKKAQAQTEGHGDGKKSPRVPPACACCQHRSGPARARRAQTRASQWERFVPITPQPR